MTTTRTSSVLTDVDSQSLPPYTEFDENSNSHQRNQTQTVEKTVPPTAVKSEKASVWRRLFCRRAKSAQTDEGEEPQYTGHFKKPCYEYSIERVSDRDDLDSLIKYTMRSLHLPLEYRGGSNSIQDSPWFVTVAMSWENLDIFTGTRLLWRENLGSVWKDSISCDLLPVNDNLDTRMYRRDFELLWCGDEINGTTSPRSSKFGNSWVVDIIMWSKDLDWLKRDWTSSMITEIVNPQTTQRIEGWIVENEQVRPHGYSTFYSTVDHETPSSGIPNRGSFGEETGTRTADDVTLVEDERVVNVDMPELRQMFHERSRVQLFGTHVG